MTGVNESVYYGIEWDRISAELANPVKQLPEITEAHNG